MAQALLPRLSEWPTTPACEAKIVVGLGLLGLAVAGHSLLATWYEAFKGFRLVGYVKRICAYPVASCQGLVSDTATCTKEGLSVMGLRDWQFVVAVPAGPQYEGIFHQYITAGMAHIEVFTDGREIIVSADDADSIRCEHILHTGDKGSMTQRLQGRKLHQIRCAGNIVAAVDMGDDIAAWFSSYLSKPGLRLFQCIQQVKTINLGRGNLGNYVIMTQESTDYLNAHVMKSQNAVSPTYTRPNILVWGCQPLDESKWREIRIGTDVMFEVTCSDIRIVKTKGESQHHSSRMTLRKEAKSHRLDKAQVLSAVIPSTVVGVNAVLVREGEMCVGDPVYATRRRHWGRLFGF